MYYPGELYDGKADDEAVNLIEHPLGGALLHADCELPSALVDDFSHLTVFADTLERTVNHAVVCSFVDGNANTRYVLGHLTLTLSIKIR